MNFEKTSFILLRLSFAGLALFIPFSIAGANIAIGFGILGMILATAAVKGEREVLQRIKNDPVFMVSLLLIITGLVSALMSENMQRGLREWKSYWLLVIYLLVGFHLIDSRARKTTFWILFGSATISGLIALIQSAGGIDLLFIHIGHKTRARSTLFIMTFAGVFYQLILVNFAMLLKEKKFTKTLLILLAGIIIQSAAFLFAQSRGSWIALFIGMISVVVILRNKKALVITVLLLVFISITTLINPTLRSRFESVLHNIKNPQDRSIKTRYILWDISLDIIKDRPILGTGIGDFSIEAENRLNGRFVKSISDAHNIFLQVLATRGIIGFTIFVLFWIAVFRSLFSIIKAGRSSNSFNYHLAVGAAAAAIALLAGALTENNIDDSEVFIAFMFILGLARSTWWNDEKIPQ